MINDSDAATPSDRSLQRAPGDGLWVDLRRLTPARIGLRRSGASLATEPLLDLQLARARARDAVHEPLDEPRLIAKLAGLGLPVLSVARLGAQVKVSWPSTNASGFSLEQAGALTTQINWVDNTASVADDGTTRSVTVPATNAAQYFRLQEP
jgi:hypothetical protein